MRKNAPIKPGWVVFVVAAVVNKAYEQLQRAEMREKYRDVIEEAKKRVLKENAKENKRRRTREHTCCFR